jgi:uncharacterized protein (DUF58 family)
LADSLHNFMITVRRPVHGPQQGLHRSLHFGSSVEFAEYRQYTPGDPPNLIDWSVYARSDRYVIRRFHEETNLRAYVLLDTSQSLDFRDEGRMSKQDYACFLAASLMYVLVHQGDAVGLMLFDDHVHKSYDLVGTLEGMRPLLRALEDVRPTGRGDIEQAVHEAAGLMKSKSLVLLVSDLLQEPANIVRGIRHLSHDGHNSVVLHVMDPGERRLSMGGVAELRDMETGERLLIEIDEIRDAYDDAVRGYLDELRHGCTECMSDYHLIDTSNAVQDELKALERKG